MCIFKQYSNIFGKVGEGVHKLKFMNVIVIDNLLTILLSTVISYFINIPFPIVIIGVYILSIIIHYLFGVQTKTLSYLGIKCS